MALPAANLRLRRDAIWVVCCRIVGIAATLASNIVAARLLGPAEFGTYLLVTTVIALGSLIGMSGLSEAALRFIAESLGRGQPDRAAAYMQKALRVAAITTVVAAGIVTCLLAAYLLAISNRFPSMTLLALVAIGIGALAWQQLGAEMLRGFGDLRFASLFSGGQAGGPVSNLLFLAGLCLTTYLAAPLDSTIAIAIAVGSVCITSPLAYTALAARSRLTGGSAQCDGLSAHHGSELLTVGSMLLLNQLLVFATQQLDVLLAGGLLNSVDLGIYGAAKRSLLIAAMPVQMATLTILPAIPRLYAQSRLADLEFVVRKAANAAAIPSLLALGLLVLFPRPILGFVLRDSYADASSLILLMAAGYLALTLSGNPQHVLTMTGRHRAVLIVNLASALILAGCGTLAAWYFGARGLAAASAVCMIVQNGLLWWLVRREFGIATHVGLTAERQETGGQEFAGAAVQRGLASEMVRQPDPIPSSLPS